MLDGPGGSVATVTEYMVNGSLRNALQKNERFISFSFFFSKRKINFMFLLLYHLHFYVHIIFEVI